MPLARRLIAASACLSLLLGSVLPAEAALFRVRGLPAAKTAPTRGPARIVLEAGLPAPLHGASPGRVRPGGFDVEAPPAASPGALEAALEARTAPADAATDPRRRSASSPSGRARRRAVSVLAGARDWLRTEGLVAGRAPSRIGSGLVASPGATGGGRSAEGDVPPPDGPRRRLPASFWGLFSGSLIVLFGTYVHVMARPFLVMDAMGLSRTTMGLERNVHMAGMAAANVLPIGLLIDKTDYRVVLVGTALVRMALMGAIPLLFLSGHLTLAALLALTAINPLFQNTTIQADTTARQAILGRDEGLNKEGAAVSQTWTAIASVAMPVVAGLMIGALFAHFGVGGYALAYAAYAVLLLASAPVYWLSVRDPRDPAQLGWSGFFAFARSVARFLPALVLAMLRTPVALLKLARRLWKERAAPREGGSAWARLRDRWAESLDKNPATTGFAHILRTKVLLVLTAVTAIGSFVTGGLSMVVMPNFITDVLGTAPGLSLPLLGELFATAAGVYGLILAVEALGTAISSYMMQGPRGDGLIRRLGHGFFYRLAAVGTALFGLIWLSAVLFPGMFWANLGVVLAVRLAMALLNAPVLIVMAPVRRKLMPDDGQLARVNTASSMISLFALSIGALLSGLLLDSAGTVATLGILALALIGMALVEWRMPRWIFPDGKRPSP